MMEFNSTPILVYAADGNNTEEHYPIKFFDDRFPWHVILGISIIGLGAAITVVCALWSCSHNYCCERVPKKIGKLQVIVRQPSIASLGEDSYQHTWITTTSMSTHGEHQPYVYPSIFDILPALNKSQNKENDSSHLNTDKDSDAISLA